MTRRRARTAGVVAAALLVMGEATGAGADGRGASLGAELGGYQEVPAVSTAGAGSFRAHVSADGTQIRYRLSYRELSGPAVQAHIHIGQEGVNGGVSAFLCSNLPSPPVGTPACPDGGTVRGTIEADDVVGPAEQGIAAGEIDELLAAIGAEVGYVNVHTELYPDGEIRGQIDEDDD